jgi:hypothetical protein
MLTRIGEALGNIDDPEPQSLALLGLVAIKKEA